MANLITLSAAQLKRAASIKEKISRLEQELSALLGAPAKPAKVVRKKRKISAAGLARIKAAQKARWAKVKAAK
jgi:hypothetical protein